MVPLFEIDVNGFKDRVPCSKVIFAEKCAQTTLTHWHLIKLSKRLLQLTLFGRLSKCLPIGVLYV